MWLQIVTTIGAFGFLVTATVVICIYVLQRRDSLRASRREVRVRLTQNYMNYHAELLRTPGNIELSREIFFQDYSAHDTSKILFMYMWLNAVHLEWHFSEHFGHPKAAMRQTIDGLYGRFVRKLSERNRFLIDDFDRLFSDFSPEFRAEMRDCIARNSPARSTQQEAQPLA